jgi:5-formyltetrahydrofolate cyclo-ligase
MSNPDPIALDNPDIERKAALRAAALARRDTLTPAERAAGALAAAAHPLPVGVKPGQVVSGFSAIRSEINPLPLMRRFAEQGAVLALPAIAGRGRPLEMRVWDADVPLVRGQWGIREPHALARVVVPDIFIVPLATFDRRGHRIGYGAGYYDMTIAAARAQKHSIAIGLAFAIQESDDEPRLAHDQPLDFVLTEREGIVCRRT